MSNWTIVKPDYNKPLRITIFDDGNNQYKNFTNKWFLCGVWKGKVKLINVDNITIINSISEWKTQTIKFHT